MTAEKNEDEMNNNEEHGGRPNYYAVIPAIVRYHKNLSASEKLLYGEITALCNKEGYCWARNGYFAQLYDCSITAVSGWISNLAEKGLVRVEQKVEQTGRNTTTGQREFRTRRYIWIVEMVVTEGGLKEKHKGGLKEKLKHNTIKNIISSSKEEEQGEKDSPCLPFNKFKRTSSKEHTHQNNLHTSTQEYIDHWNGLGGGIIKHTNPNTITYKSCIKMLKQLEQGTFIAKHLKLGAFLEVNHLPIRFDGKQWTREEILNALDRLHKWCILNKRRMGLKEVLYNPHHPTGLLSLFLIVASDERWKAIRRGKEQAEDQDPVRTEQFCKLMGVNGDLSKRQEVMGHLQSLRTFRLSLPPEDKSTFAYGIDYHCPRTEPGKFLDHFSRWLEWQKDWLKNPSPGILSLKGGVVKKYLDEKWGKGLTGYKGKSVVEFLPV